MTQRRRVVVTGVGLRTPLGSTKEQHVRASRTGISGVTATREWDHIARLGPRVVGAVADEATRPYARRVRRTMGRVGLLAVSALEDAIDDSRLPPETVTDDRTWLILGSTLGALADIEQLLLSARQADPFAGASTATGLRAMAHTAAISCALHLGLRGRVVAPAAACATGCVSIGLGYEAIRDGRADVVFAGGADERHASTAIIFDTLHAASVAYSDRPGSTPRPFDAARDGVVCAEGAGVLVLESMEGAMVRGARIYGEVSGFATVSAGGDPATPDRDAIVRCMEAALRDAEFRAEDVDYVNAHATGTLAGDAVEAQAIAEVLGGGVPVSSSKGHLGHTMAAAGAIEAVLCLLMLEQQAVWPTLNLDEVADDCRCVSHVQRPRGAELRHVLSNNFALGGILACVALSSVA